MEEAGKMAEAWDCFSSALKMGPSAQLLYEAYNGRGNVLMDWGRAEEAIEEYRKAIAQDASVVHAWNGLGNALKGIGDMEEALEAYNNALKRDPQYMFALVGKGNVFLDEGNYEDALQMFEAGCKAPPRSPLPLMGKGTALARLNEPVRALECYQRAVAIAPKFAGPYYCIAFLLNDQPALAATHKIRAESYFLRGSFLEQSKDMTSGKALWMAEFLKTVWVPLLTRDKLLENPTLATALEFSPLWKETLQDCQTPDFLVAHFTQCDLSVAKRDFALGLTYLHYGNPFVALKCFRDAMDAEPWNLQFHFYVLTCLNCFMEPCEVELSSACSHAMSPRLKENMQFYYAGHIHLLADNDVAAVSAFEKAGEFLPALYMRWFLAKGENRSADALLEQVFAAEADIVKSVRPFGYVIAPEEPIYPDRPERLLDAALHMAHFREISGALAALQQEQNLTRISSYQKLFRNDIKPRFSPDVYQDQLKTWRLHHSAKSRLDALKLKRLQEDAIKLRNEATPFLEAKFAVDAKASKPISVQIGDHIFSQNFSEPGTPSAKDVENIVQLLLLDGLLTLDDAALLFSYFQLKYRVDRRELIPANVSSWTAKILSVLLPLVFRLPPAESAIIQLCRCLAEYAVTMAKAGVNRAQFPRFQFFKEDIYKYYAKFSG